MPSTHQVSTVPNLVPGSLERNVKAIGGREPSEIDPPRAVENIPVE